jgi:hypothetical protein
MSDGIFHQLWDAADGLLCNVNFGLMNRKLHLPLHHSQQLTSQAPAEG